ncbi:hypothetical protein FPHYL_13375 [Fusarium phyllophilum]|uniref:Uncharacterized protein n=1 Tax=Fusarium phyllophilum TaxID=47803 RepID=A0A8H5MMK6_9HYPO|nr:hypothetical protein FPHYL_13375 [Fusarium phyllophilum]
MSTSNTLKRPATDTPTGSTSPAKKRGRPKKSDDHVENEHARANAVWLKENCTPFDIADLDSHVGELFRPSGNGWTESLERSMNGMWRDGIYSKAKERYEVTPVRLISFLELLEYHPDRAHLDVFSKQFCAALASLILHPAMKAKRQRIVICLQYAVLCRIDDRRIWPLSSSTSKYSVIASMIEVMKQAEDRKSDRPIHDVLISCFLACEEKGEKPSETANLLQQIGKTVRSSKPGPEVGDDMLVYRGRRVYPVSLHDLQNVIKTLDETEWEEESWRCTAQESYDSYISLNLRNSDIPRWRQLTEHYERSHKNTLREWMLQTGFNPGDGRSNSRESPGGSTYGEAFDSDHERCLETSLHPHTGAQVELDGNEDQIENEGDLELGDLGDICHDSPRPRQESGWSQPPPAQSPVTLSNVSQSRRPIQPTEGDEPPHSPVSPEKFKAMELYIKHLETKVEGFENVLLPLQRSHEKLQRKVKLLESSTFSNNSSRNGPAHSVPRQEDGIVDSNHHDQPHLPEPSDTSGLSAMFSWAKEKMRDTVAALGEPSRAKFVETQKSDLFQELRARISRMVEERDKSIKENDEAVMATGDAARHVGLKYCDWKAVLNRHEKQLFEEPKAVGVALNSCDYVEGIELILGEHRNFVLNLGRQNA